MMMMMKQHPLVIRKLKLMGHHNYHVANEYLDNKITETDEEYGNDEDSNYDVVNKDLNNNMTETDEAYLNGYDEDSNYHVANEDLD
eukprot:Pgem_evm1s10789